jgi:hypothetical protein
VVTTAGQTAAASGRLPTDAAGERWLSDDGMAAAAGEAAAAGRGGPEAQWTGVGERLREAAAKRLSGLQRGWVIVGLVLRLITRKPR